MSFMLQAVHCIATLTLVTYFLRCITLFLFCCHFTFFSSSSYYIHNKGIKKMVLSAAMTALQAIFFLIYFWFTCFHIGAFSQKSLP